MKEKNIIKEIRMFSRMETLRIESDLIRVIEPFILQDLLSIEIVDKMIHIPSKRFTEYQKKISSLRFYVDENLTFPFESMHYLQSLYIDVLP